MLQFLTNPVPVWVLLAVVLVPVIAAVIVVLRVKEPDASAHEYWNQ